MSTVTPYAGSLRSVMANIWSVMRLAWHEDWRLVTGRGALRALSAGIPAAQAYIGKLLFDPLSASYGSGASRAWRAALGDLLLEGLLLAARTAFQSAGRLLDANLNHLLRFGITRRIMAHAAELDVSSYEEPQLHERMQRISDETPWRMQGVLGAIFNTLLSDLGYLCGVGALARGVVLGALTVGDAVLFIGAFKTAQASLGTIAEATGELYESSRFITDLQTFLQMSPRLVAPRGPRPAA